MTETSVLKPVLAAAALAVLATASAQGTAPAPVRGGSITVALNSEPPGGLDLSQTPAQELARMFYLNVMEGLVGLNEAGKIVPVLATALPTVSNDGLAYTFKLRPNVKFHDGKALSSADVKAKFDWARSDALHVGNQTGYFSSINRIDTPDKNTVVFRLKRPDSELVFNLARPESTIGPSASKFQRESQKTKPIGTGPFKFDTWRRGYSLRIARNTAYHQPGLPYLDAVTFRFMGADENAKVNALRAGDIDVIGYNVPSEQVTALKNDNRFKVVSGTATAEIVIGLNHRRKPFNDIRVRQAFNHAIDRQEIIKGAFNGYGVAIGSHRSPTERYYVNLANTYPYDPEKARQLLAAAGYENGLKVKFTVTNEFPVERRTAEVYAAQLKKVGVDAEIELVPFSPTWIERVYGGHDYDMTIIGHVEPEDIGIWSDPKYYFGYDSKAFQDLWAKVPAATAEDAKSKLYGDMQRQLARDAAAVWAFSAPNLSAMRANVHGWWANQPTPSMNVVRVFKTR